MPNGCPRRLCVDRERVARATREAGEAVRTRRGARRAHGGAVPVRAVSGHADVVRRCVPREVDRRPGLAARGQARRCRRSLRVGRRTRRRATGVFMSAWSSLALSARLCSRTSSICPWNHSVRTLFPPICSALVEFGIEPVNGLLATATPFTLMRWLASAKVVARYAQLESAGGWSRERCPAAARSRRCRRPAPCRSSRRGRRRRCPAAPWSAPFASKLARAAARSLALRAQRCANGSLGNPWNVLDWCGNDRRPRGAGRRLGPCRS